MKYLATLIVVLGVAGCSPSAPPQSAATADIAERAPIPMTSKSPEAVAHVKKGEAFLANVRQTDAEAEFSEALKLDGDFVLARAYHGAATPGPAGLQELEAAASAASALPEAERTLVNGLLATRQGEAGKARDAYVTLTQSNPGDWRGHYLLGTTLLGEENYADAIPALKKAIELDPAAGGANNMLGYAALRQDDAEGAIKAFTDYARALPQEPNAQDSLGEALLAAGRFGDAEAAFRKALELSPQFFPAWNGIAYAKYFSGDFAAAREALAKEKQVAVTPVDKFAADELLAIMTIAQKNTAEGLSLYASLDRRTDAMPAVAFASSRRAGILADSGRAREAFPIVAAAIKRTESGELPAGMSRNLRRLALTVRATAETATNNADAAQQTAIALQQLAAERKDDVTAQSAMHYGLGMAAMAKGDYAGARQQFEQCLKQDEICRMRIVSAAEKAGDKAGAAAAKAELLKLYVRTPVHVWVRSQLQDKATKTTE